MFFLYENTQFEVLIASKSGTTVMMCSLTDDKAEWSQVEVDKCFCTRVYYTQYELLFVTQKTGLFSISDNACCSSMGNVMIDDIEYCNNTSKINKVELS